MRPIVWSSRRRGSGGADAFRPRDTRRFAWPRLSSVAKGFGSVAPGSIGIQETGIVLLCRLAGAPDSFGVAYAVVRRGRELTDAGLGWLMLFLEESTIRGFSQRVERDARAES